ncbi:MULTISPECIES: hypothetical protein [unclassified Adlercreutzia]|uniref:hypothetical protein n=1 Tax=unclassified Adlercreutzia TaxID=2636013 RepID=UPI0013E9BA16|nr:MULTISPECIES: hypothetical protein [unclassified Adlercreutzia]
MKMKKLIAAILLGALLTFSLVAFTGCGSNDEQVIRDAITDELNSYKTLDDEVVNTLIADMDADELSDYGIDGAEFIKSYLAGFDYTIDSVTVDGDTAEAVITMTCKSYSGFEQALEEAATGIMEDESLMDMSEEEVNDLIGSTIMDALDNVELAQTEPITIAYTKNGNVWEPAASTSNDVATALMTN